MTDAVRYFGVFREDQTPAAFYTTDVWDADDLPSNSVELTESQWRDFISNPGARQWSDDGPMPFVPPSPPVRIVVSRAQAKLALHRAGLLDAVKTVVSAAGGEAQIWFDEALTWEIDNPYVAQLGGAVGLEPDDIIALFETASAIAA